MSWLFGNKKQKYIENLKKNNKIREEKETYKSFSTKRIKI